MKALVLSGGGCKGAYQVGAIQWLLGSHRTRYEAYCGVSVGALNSSLLAQYPLGAEEQAARRLLDVWYGIDSGSIYKRWFLFGRLAALWKPSLYNSEPLQDLVRESLDVRSIRYSGKKLRIGAVALQSGTYRAFDENFGDIAGAVLASASSPAMLCPVELEGQLWTDGGVRNITPLAEAIELGATEIDVVICSPENAKYPLSEKPSTLKVAERSIDIMTDEIITNDLRSVRLYNRLVDAGAAGDKKSIKLTVLRPTRPLIGDSMDFDPVKLRMMILQGTQDAKALWP